MKSEGKYELLGRESYCIGRGSEFTPQLNLSEHASRKHLMIRLGNMAGNLHFMDLDSENGSIVKIHEEDCQLINSPTRTWYSTDPFITLEHKNQRWTRYEE